MDSYKEINDMLVKLYRGVMNREEKALITEEYKDISANDMHIIEAIGVDEPHNMSSVAQFLSVTMGTLTTAINALVQKGYVDKKRSDEDRRVTFLSLTEKGKQAYNSHDCYHRELVNAVVGSMTEEELPIFARALNNLNRFLG